MPVTINPLDDDLNIIQRLDEEPNDVGGLSSSELQARFDESGNIIKRYLNGSLVPAVNRLGDSVGAYDTRLDGLSGGLDEVSAKVDDLWTKLENGELGAGSGSGSASGADLSVITQRLEDAEGNISQLQQTASSITARVSDAEGNVSLLRQTATSLSSRVSDAEGNVSALSQTAASLDSRVASAEGGVSALRQTVDGFSFSVSEPAPGGDGSSYVTLTISMGGNTWRGVVAIDGNVDVSGSLSASALYATMGDIAKLTVDSLATSRRIPLFLAHDTSPDEYIRIEGKFIRFIHAVTDGSVQQALDPGGSLLYWEQDISGATLGSDGYPRQNGARVFTTTSPTAWPVQVYVYSELQKIQLRFLDNLYNEPLFVFGAGIASDADPDRGRGYIQKQGDGFKIWYLDSQGTERGLWMGEDGTRILGGVPSGDGSGEETQPGTGGESQQRTSVLDFSGWDTGSFRETLDGAVIQYTVAFDGAGRPVSITDSGGNATSILW